MNLLVVHKFWGSDDNFSKNTFLSCSENRFQSLIPDLIHNGNPPSDEFCMLFTEILVEICKSTCTLKLKQNLSYF